MVFNSLLSGGGGKQPFVLLSSRGELALSWQLVLTRGCSSGVALMDSASDNHRAAGVVAASTYLALVKGEPVESVQVGPSAAFPVLSLHFRWRLSFAPD